jgi:hypothetical protein
MRTKCALGHRNPCASIDYPHSTFRFASQMLKTCAQITAILYNQLKHKKIKGINLLSPLIG